MRTTVWKLDFLLVADGQLCKLDLHYAAMKFLPTAAKNEHISIFVDSHFSRKNLSNWKSGLLLCEF